MVQVEWERDLLISLVVTVVLGVLAQSNAVSITSISPALAAAIFTVIIGTVGTLFSILTLYGEIIASAKDSSTERKDYVRHLKRTFSVPVNVAVLGFIIAVISNLFTLNIELGRMFLFSVDEWFSLGMLFLLLYSILSFKEAFSFIIRTVIRRELRSRDSTDKHEISTEEPESKSMEEDK